MKKNYLSATEVKENISEILSNAYFRGKVTIVKRYGKPIAKIIPIEEKPSPKMVKKSLAKFFGTEPEFPELKKDRNFRSREINL